MMLKEIDKSAMTNERTESTSFVEAITILTMLTTAGSRLTGKLLPKTLEGCDWNKADFYCGTNMSILYFVQKKPRMLKYDNDDDKP